MSEPSLKLKNPPIVEAVVDIDCDMPPTFDLSGIEATACAAFQDTYPRLQKQLLGLHTIKTKAEAQPEMSFQHHMNALQFLHDDQKQLVQVRTQGFSFNRLSPYTSLDDYLPEIERTWRLFLGLCAPVQITLIRLRYINRFKLPTVQGKVNLDDYLEVGPHLPDEEMLTFAGFLNQHTSVEIATNNLVNTVLTSQPPEGEFIPIIFDNAATATGPHETDDWPWIQSTITSLRRLKNHVFEKTLTAKCLNLFQL